MSQVIARHDAEARAVAAQHAQQVQELQNELGALRRHARVLEDERLSAQEAMGKYYSTSLQVSRHAMQVFRLTKVLPILQLLLVPICHCPSACSFS